MTKWFEIADFTVANVIQYQRARARIPRFDWIMMRKLQQNIQGTRNANVVVLSLQVFVFAQASEAEAFIGIHSKTKACAHVSE